MEIKSISWFWGWVFGAWAGNLIPRELTTSFQFGCTECLLDKSGHCECLLDKVWALCLLDKVWVL